MEVPPPPRQIPTFLRKSNKILRIAEEKVRAALTFAQVLERFDRIWARNSKDVEHLGNVTRMFPIVNSLMERVSRVAPSTGGERSNWYLRMVARWVYSSQSRVRELKQYRTVWVQNRTDLMRLRYLSKYFPNLGLRVALGTPSLANCSELEFVPLECVTLESVMAEPEPEIEAVKMEGMDMEMELDEMEERMQEIMGDEMAEEMEEEIERETEEMLEEVEMEQEELWNSGV